MYITAPEASPWEKRVSFLLKSTIFRATPAESRKACASKGISLGLAECFVIFTLTANTSRFSVYRTRGGVTTQLSTSHIRRKRRGHIPFTTATSLSLLEFELRRCAKKDSRPLVATPIIPQGKSRLNTAA